MDTLARTIRSVKQTFFIYTVEEAKENKIEFFHWKEAKEKMYAVSDDGYVALCIAVREYKNSKGVVSREMKFPYGRVWVSKGTKLLYEDRKWIGNWSAAAPKTWIDYEVKRTRVKRLVKEYVRQSLSGQVDYHSLGMLYRPDQLIPEATVKRLLKQEKIQELIQKEQDKLSGRIKKTYEDVFDGIDKAIKIAEEKKDARALLSIADFLAKLLGVYK
jgi:histone H3/H4